MKKVRIHYFQHVHFEGLAGIGEWAARKGHPVTGTLFFEDHHLPDHDSYDWLIIMGGPMSVNDETGYPWLIAEKAFIGEAIALNKTIVGVCLGSQLIAAALGAVVYPNKVKEIGWWPIENAFIQGDEYAPYRLNRPEVVFHWHGDTFDLPQGAVHLYRSDDCHHQGFIIGKKVLGLQFHFEVNHETILEMVSGNIDELMAGGPRVQSQQEILNEVYRCEGSNRIMFRVLDHLASLPL